MIYIIQAGIEGPIKVGYTKDKKSLASRIRSIQTGCAEKVRLLHYCEGERDFERKIHKSLSVDRMNGEWFKASPRINQFLDLLYDLDVSAALERLPSPPPPMKIQYGNRVNPAHKLYAVLLNDPEARKIFRTPRSKDQELAKEFSIPVESVNIAREILFDAGNEVMRRSSSYDY